MKHVCASCGVTTYGTVFCSDQCEVAYVPAPGLVEPETVNIQTEPCTWSEQIYILIPPKYWGNSKLAEGIRKAIQATFDRQNAESTMNGWPQKRLTHVMETLPIP